jgi:hypothetical protein
MSRSRQTVIGVIASLGLAGVAISCAATGDVVEAVGWGMVSVATTVSVVKSRRSPPSAAELTRRRNVAGVAIVGTIALVVVARWIWGGLTG